MDDVLGTVKILKNQYGQYPVAMKEVLGGKSIEFQTFIKINLKSQRMIQKQTWKDEIRILITDEENLSSVQIFIPLYVSDIFGKADALIYALFVDNNYRRKGVAKSLLQLAEQQAKLNGVKTIGLHFVEEESDRFVLDWYLRSGYKLFDKKSNLLIKKLEEQLWYVLIVSVRNLYLKQSLTKLYIAGETIMVLANAQKYHKVALRNSSEGNYLGMMSQQNLKRIKQNNYGCYFINYNDFDSSYLCGSCYSKYCFSSYVFHRRV